jgi:hypothetical protein
MRRVFVSRTTHLRRWLPLLAVAAAALLAAQPARADVIVGVQSVPAVAGSTGNKFEVFLTNTGAPITVAGFSFGVTSSNPGITFTQATTATTPHTYIFPSSFFAPVINTSSGTSLEAIDLDNNPLGETIGTGQTVGLGEVFFNVAANVASGVYPITLQPYPSTSLSDPSANNIPITTLRNGAISVSGGTAVGVPEPATLLLAALGWPAGAWAARRRRRAAAKR